MKYYIGQRVIVDRNKIAVVIKYEDGRTWVRLPDGVEQWRGEENICALPGGQL